MKLMIVDDNERMRKAIIEMVTNPADQIFECSNGYDAVGNYSKFNPDWILMDIKMQRMNGIVATRKIKEINPDANIVFVTNYNEKVYRNEAELIGVKYYFLKSDLLKIREVLDKTS